MLQNIAVTLVAIGALAAIVRRFSGSWLPVAFRPARKQEACNSCPLVEEAVKTRRV